MSNNIEELKLLKRISESDKEASEELVRRYKKEITLIASSLYELDKTLEIEDLIQEGYIGLMKALNQLLYGCYSDRKKITGVIRQGVKREMVSAIIKQSEFNVTTDKTEFRWRLLSNTSTYNETYSEEETKAKVESLDQIKEDYITTKTEPIDTKHSEEELFEKVYRENVISQVFKKCNLTKREQEVLALFYGFNERKPLGFEEISRLKGFSKQYYSNLYRSAMKKINDNRELDEIITEELPDEDYVRAKKYILGVTKH